ncbi:WSC domain-containing protein 2, partial [Aspergillus udagawae]
MLHIPSISYLVIYDIWHVCLFHSYNYRLVHYLKHHVSIYDIWRVCLFHSYNYRLVHYLKHH